MCKWPQGPFLEGSKNHTQNEDLNKKGTKLRCKKAPPKKCTSVSCRMRTTTAAAQVLTIGELPSYWEWGSTVIGCYWQLCARDVRGRASRSDIWGLTNKKQKEQGMVPKGKVVSRQPCVGYFVRVPPCPLHPRKVENYLPAIPICSVWMKERDT